MKRKLFAILATSILACSQVSAFCCSFLPEVAESNLSLGVGYRRDSFDWKSGSCDCGRSQRFKNINIWEIALAGKYVTCNDVYFRGYADYGWITSGRREHHEFLLEDEDADFDYGCFRSKLKGDVYDVSIALGYQFRWCDDSFAVSPVLGYAWDSQHFKGSRRDESSTPDDEAFANIGLGGFDGVNGKYNARWNGPFLGIDLEYAIWCDWTIFASYEYHWARFNAKTRFGCDYQTFHSARNAHGQVGFLGASWDFCHSWTLSLIGEYSWFKTSGGHSKTKLANCLEPTDCETFEISLKSPLKKVTWKSGSIYLDLGYVF